MKEPSLSSSDHPAPDAGSRQVPETVQEELCLLGELRRVLLEHPVTVDVSDREALIEMATLREQVAGAKDEDLGSIFQQYELLAHRVRQLQASSAAGMVDPDCPYFAHLRLEDQRGLRDLFLGRGTRLDHGLRIVDWRNAPVSRVFYRYREGEEYEERLGDQVLSGRVRARRTVGIAGGSLYRVDTGSSTWLLDDERWRPLERPRARLAGGAGGAFRAHEAPHPRTRMGTGLQLRADKHLPEIAALIDPEQFELITAPGSGLVALRGTAGSGKTTVALHRIAYLAYAEPRRFLSHQMLVLVWGRALQRYVSHVLPSLGIEGVRVVTWEEWARSLRQRHFGRLPRGVREDTPSALARVKLHPLLAELLRRRILARGAPSKGNEAIDDYVSFLADGERQMATLAREAPGDLPDRVLEQAGRQMLEQASGLRAWLEGDRDDSLLLDAEDDALLLYTWQQRVGPLHTRRRRPLRYAHLVIDEVQDFSPVEVRVALGCLDARRCANLAGDTAQNIMDSTGFSDWERFFQHLGLEGTVVETLRVAYRSTAPIAAFGRRLLGRMADREPPARAVRSGPPVEIFRFTDHGACVAFLGDVLRDLTKAEPMASVALIAPDSAVARLYHEGLRQAELPHLGLVLDQEFSFEPGIEISRIQDVKGLEFDYVVLLEASASCYPDTDLARRQLHVGATRAIHQLWVTTVGTPSAAIRQELAEALQA